MNLLGNAFRMDSEVKFLSTKNILATQNNGTYCLSQSKDKSVSDTVFVNASPTPKTNPSQILS